MAAATAAEAPVHFRIAATSELPVSRERRSPASAARRRAATLRRRSNSVAHTGDFFSGREVSDRLIVAGRFAWFAGPRRPDQSLVHGRQDQTVKLRDLWIFRQNTELLSVAFVRIDRDLLGRHRTNLPSR